LVEVKYVEEPSKSRPGQTSCRVYSRAVGGSGMSGAGTNRNAEKARSRLARAAYEASGAAEEGSGSQSKHCKAASAHERARQAFLKAGRDRRAYLHEQKAMFHSKRCG